MTEKTAAIHLRGLEIGRGIPKIIVPIVGRTGREIRRKAEEIVASGADMAEWRADYYEALQGPGQTVDINSAVETARTLRSILNEMPLLFTFRSAKEGGVREISAVDYAALNLAVAGSGAVDAVDVEVFAENGSERTGFHPLIAGLHDAGVAVVASNHIYTFPDAASAFSEPLLSDALYARLLEMAATNADIVKLAIMPRDGRDVLALEKAVLDARSAGLQNPLIAIAMGKQGIGTRVCAELIGSAMTFGAIGEASAPGQLSVEKLRTVLDILHSGI